jgi:hypothetical protein
MATMLFNMLAAIGALEQWLGKIISPSGKEGLI